MHRRTRLRACSWPGLASPPRQTITRAIADRTASNLQSAGCEPTTSPRSAAANPRPSRIKGVVLVRHGIRFGFLGYTFDQQNGNWRDIDTGIADTDTAAVCRDVAALRKRADVVIVSMHNGIEYMPRPRKHKSRLPMPPLMPVRDAGHRASSACRTARRDLSRARDLLLTRKFCIRSVPARSHPARRDCRGFVPWDAMFSPRTSCP